MLLLLLVTAVAATGYGEIFTWGFDERMPPYDILGYDASNSSIPRLVPWNEYSPAPIVVDMCAGAQFTLVLTADGKLWSWGNNSLGQLGDGSFAPRVTPGPVLLAVTPRKISCGAQHTLVLGADGDIYAWGDNSLGQLGIDEPYTVNSENTPTAVAWGAMYYPAKPTEIVSIAAYCMDSAAVDEHGLVYAWGNNEYMQLGMEQEANAYIYMPQLVIGFSAGGVATVSGGASFSTVLMGNGSVYMIGDNQRGELGQGDYFAYFGPVEVKWGDLPAPRITLIAHGLSSPAGPGHFNPTLLVLVSDGYDLYTWGDNGRTGCLLGQGIDMNRLSSPTPGKVVWGAVPRPTSAFISLGVTVGTGVALTASGDIYCWGDSGLLLGTGQSWPAGYPIGIKTTYGVPSIAAGAYHVAAFACVAPNCLPSYTPSTSPSVTTPVVMPSSTPLVSITRTPSPSPSASAAPAPKTPDGSIVGIAVGAGLGAALLFAGILVVVYRIQRRRKRQRKPDPRLGDFDPPRKERELTAFALPTEVTPTWIPNPLMIPEPNNTPGRAFSSPMSPVRHLKKSLFISYGRSPNMTKFVRRLKTDLIERGFTMWMDEEGIHSGENFMEAIGQAIQACEGIIACIDDKYCKSKFCKNELFLANTENKALFPCMFADARPPPDVKYALVNIPTIEVDQMPFEEALEQLVARLETRNVVRTWNHQLHAKYVPARRHAVVTVLMLVHPGRHPRTPFFGLPPNVVDGICFYVAGGCGNRNTVAALAAHRSFFR